MLPKYQYLIVGGGMTAKAAVMGIREVDATGSIALFSLEKYPPYSRPPLSKSLWKGKPIEKIWLMSPDEKVDLNLNRRVVALDVIDKQVRDDLGGVYQYEKLLLATGGKPRQLPFGEGSIIYFRTLDDYLKLRTLTGQGKRFFILGGGFIGSELAAALAMNGERVTMLFPEAGIGARIFPNDLSIFLNDYYQKKGVEVLPGVSLAEVDQQGGRLLLRTAQGQTFQGDHIIAGLGVLPDVALAEEAKLKLENGIMVDEYLRTSQPDVYAAGDAASFYNPILAMRMRAEHEDNALNMGKAAGKNMALTANGSQPLLYDHLPYFYSDLFELGYEAVGELDPRLETFSDWQTPFEKGVIYYLNQERVRGILLWNVWGQVDAARQLIAEPGPISAEDLKARRSLG